MPNDRTVCRGEPVVWSSVYSAYLVPIKNTNMTTLFYSLFWYRVEYIDTTLHCYYFLLFPCLMEKNGILILVGSFCYSLCLSVSLSVRQNVEKLRPFIAQKLYISTLSKEPKMSSLYISSTLHIFVLYKFSTCNSLTCKS